jgi:hypothetical protein
MQGGGDKKISRRGWRQKLPPVYRAPLDARGSCPLGLRALLLRKGGFSEMFDRIDGLRDAARLSGLTIDFLQLLTEGLSRQAFRRVIGNASSMPSNMKSSDSPNVFRKASAPFNDSR